MRMVPVGCIMSKYPHMLHNVVTYLVKADEFQVWANAWGDESQRKGELFWNGRPEKRGLF